MAVAKIDLTEILSTEWRSMRPPEILGGIPVRM